MKRSELQHGDVLLYERGSKHGTLLGRIIRLVTGSRYTHSAIVVENLPGERYIVEQDGKVRATLVEDYVFKRPEKVHVFRKPGLRWNRSLSMQMVWWMVGTRYGVANLFEILLQHLLGRLFPGREPIPVMLEENRKPCTCSGLVAKIMHVAAEDPTGGLNFLRHSTIVEPDDFCERRGFVHQGILHGN